MTRDVKLGLLAQDEVVAVGVPRPISTVTPLLEPSEKPLGGGGGIGPPASGTLNLAVRGKGNDSGAAVSSSICIGESFKTFSSPGVLGLEMDGFRDFLILSSGILGSSWGGSFFDIGLGELKASPDVSSSRSNWKTCSKDSEYFPFTEPMMPFHSAEEVSVTTRDGEELRGDGDGSGVGR